MKKRLFSVGKKEYNDFHLLKMLLFWILLLNIGLLHAATGDRTFDSIANIVEKTSRLQRKQSMALIEDLYRLARESKESSTLYAHSIYAESLANNRQGIIDSALIEHINKRLESSTTSVSEKALLSYSLALNLFTTGNYTEAFKSSLEASEIFEELKDPFFTSRTFNLLGNICGNIFLLDMAENYYKEALSWVSLEDEEEYYLIKNNTYRLYYYNKNIGAAIDSLLFLTEMVEGKDIKGLFPIIWLNLGVFYAQNNEMEKSRAYFEKMQALAIENPKINTTLHANLGVYYLIKNEDFEKSFEHLQIAKQNMEAIDDNFGLSILYGNLSAAFEELGKLDSALFYSRKQQKATQEVRSNIKAVEAYQSYVLAVLETSKNQLTIAEQQIVLNNRRQALTIVSALTIIIVIILALIIVQQKRRQQILLKEAEKKELKKKLAQEKKIQRLQEDKLESKVREVASFSALLSNHEQTLKHISQIAKRLPFDQPDVVEINSIINSNLTLAKERENFMTHFNKVHPRFFENLKKHCPKLTENNLRLCAYFRIGMSPKQIAQLLNVSPENVKKSRYRLKKKLGLEERDNLYDFLRNV